MLKEVYLTDRCPDDFIEVARAPEEALRVKLAGAAIQCETINGKRSVFRMHVHETRGDADKFAAVLLADAIALCEKRIAENTSRLAKLKAIQKARAKKGWER